VTAAALRQAGWRRPEWTAAAAAAVSWTIVAAGLYGNDGHAGHNAAHHHTAAAARPDLPAWTAMAAAMMVPAVLPAVRSIAFASLWRRRQRAVAVFLVSYLAVWLAFGVVALEAVDAVHARVDVGSTALLTASLVVAAAWELTGQKRRALRACHLIAPPPPRGWKADAGCARAGLTHGRRCVVSCWALMLAMAVGGHGSISLMLLLTAVVAAQKLLVRGPRLGVPACAALVGAAGIVLGG
jgi:predicted metal-binding membrane protein